MFENQYPGIDARAVAIVRSYSRHLVGRYGITVDDLPDLHQQWLSQLIRSEAYSQPDHPEFEARMGKLTGRLVADTIRHRRRVRENYGRRNYSLDDFINPAERTETFADAVSEEDYLDFSGCDYRDSSKLVDAREDVAALLRHLDPELRELAELLQRHPIGEIPELLGVSRATAFRRLDDLRRVAGRFFRTSDS